MDEVPRPRWSLREPASFSGGQAFQGRVRLYLGVLLALLSFFHLVLVAVRSSVNPSWRVLLEPDALRRLATILGGGGLAALASWRRLSRNNLFAIDIVATLMLSASSLLGVALRPAELRPELSALMTITLVLFVRAALLPSSARRTLLIGALGLGPLLAFAPLFFPAGHQLAGISYRHLMRLKLFAYGAASMAVTALVSDVIYKLRHSAQKSTRLGPYELSRKLGEGGMGVVYEARHALLRRRTALKLIRAARHDAVSEELFEREARLTSQLSHPNTVALFDYGQTADGIDYYAMEYVDGLTLLELVRRGGPLPAGRSLSILRQVAAALAAAHRQGLIHRDIKPSNVMICHQDGHPDWVKVLDFGLARSILGDTDTGSHDLLAGTPGFMAPEVLSSPLTVGPASDVYAVGVLGYFLLTGRVPVEIRSIGRISQAPPPVPPLAPSLLTGKKIPAELEEVLLTCLEKDPAARYPDGLALRLALQHCHDSEDWSSDAAEQWWQEWQLLNNPDSASKTRVILGEHDTRPNSVDPAATSTIREVFGASTRTDLSLAALQSSASLSAPSRVFSLRLPARHP